MLADLRTKSKVKPIDPISDPRVTHEYALLNGHRYHYFLGVPQDGNFKSTVFLVHGWPDLAIGWRYQIPYLIDLGCRVVVPDMMGYGETGAPATPPNSLYLYGNKRASDDLAELAKQLGANKIVLGGHDWGGMIAWRFAAYYPDLVSHLFTVCTSYTAPHKEFVSTEDLVKGPMPQFGYQLHLASGEIEKQLTTKEHMNTFIRGVYGKARTAKKEVVFSPTEGLLIDKLPELGTTYILSEKELDYYASMYARNGLQGPLNWYRTRKVNWEDEQELLDRRIIKQPTLFIAASRDNVLYPSLAAKMHRDVPQLTMKEVDGTHWVLVEKPDECNDLIGQWIRTVVWGGSSKL